MALAEKKEADSDAFCEEEDTLIEADSDAFSTVTQDSAVIFAYNYICEHSKCSQKYSTLMW